MCVCDEGKQVLYVSRISSGFQRNENRRIDAKNRIREGTRMTTIIIIVICKCLYFGGVCCVYICIKNKCHVNGEGVIKCIMIKFPRR